MNLQLGSEFVNLNGFLNTDLPQVDLRKPLPYEDATADIIVAAHVLELLMFREVPFAMKEIVRVLKPGGWIRFHFGAEKLALNAQELADILAKMSGCELTTFVVDKLTTNIDNAEVLNAKGQHGPSLVIEFQKP
jgi:ubiquinone/menaquinone biosynthesis C-methylase UbiE